MSKPICESERLFWLYLKIGKKDLALSFLQQKFEFNFFDHGTLNDNGINILDYPDHFNQKHATITRNCALQAFVINRKLQVYELDDTISKLDKFIEQNAFTNRYNSHKILVAAYLKTPKFDMSLFELYANIIDKSDAKLTSYAEEFDKVTFHDIDKIIEYARYCYSREILDDSFVKEMITICKKFNWCGPQGDNNSSTNLLKFYSVLEDELQLDLDINHMFTSSGKDWHTFVDQPIYNFAVTKGLNLALKKNMRAFMTGLRRSRSGLTQDLFVKLFKLCVGENGFDSDNTKVVLSVLFARFAYTGDKLRLDILIELAENGLDFSCFLLEKFPNGKIFCNNAWPPRTIFFTEMDEIFANFILDLYPNIRNTTAALEFLVKTRRIDEFDRILATKTKSEIDYLFNVNKLIGYYLGAEILNYAKVHDIHPTRIIANILYSEENKKLGTDYQMELLEQYLGQDFDYMVIIPMIFVKYTSTGTRKWWDLVFNKINPLHHDGIAKFLFEQCFYFRNNDHFVAQNLLKEYLDTQTFCPLEETICNDAVNFIKRIMNISEENIYFNRWVSKDSACEKFLHEILDKLQIDNFISWMADGTIQLDRCQKLSADILNQVIELINISICEERTSGDISLREIDFQNTNKLMELVVKHIEAGIFSHESKLIKKIISVPNMKLNPNIIKHLQMCLDAGLSLETLYQIILPNSIAHNSYYDVDIVRFALEQADLI
jgi:hypothetical protein